MRIHHLNCGTMCPFAAGLVLGQRKSARPHLTCHCLLIETDAHGLVLVDTGFGMRDCVRATTTLAREFLTMSRPTLSIDETAIAQVRALGHRPEDVRHILLTHLDPDHAGGLIDFPHARVHVMRAEHEAATALATANARRRYRPMQWAHSPDFRFYDVQGGAWQGFEGVQAIDGLPPEFLFVSLIGHTAGHAGIVVELGKVSLLHAGDAYFFHGEVDVESPACPLGLTLFQRVMGWDNAKRLANRERLRELIRSQGDAVRVFSAHDPVELAKQKALWHS